jgi:inner membrane protein
MDNLSHSLTGLALSRAGLNRLTPHATLLLILSANIPDIDIVALAKSQLAYLEVHRGLTHSVYAAPLLAFEVVFLVAAVYRTRLPWMQAWFVCCVGVFSHLLLDWTNDYGIRPFVPLSLEWLHLDINSLTDGPILALLAFAAVWPWLSGLVSGEIGEAKKSSGQGSAILVLLLCISYDVCRYYLHQRAVTQLQSRLYAGAPALSVAALPNPINPFSWRGMVLTKSATLEFDLNTLSDLNTESAKSFFRLPLSESIVTARRIPDFNYFLYFARFPVWSVQPVTLKDGIGTRIELTDLRFGAPGVGSFHCVALENAAGKVLGSWFTFGSGTNLGWIEPKHQ